MTDVPDTVGKQAQDVLVTVPDGHHGQDYLRSVNSITTGLPFSSSPRVSIRPRCHGPGRVLRRQEPDAKHRLQSGLDPPLQLDLERDRRTGQFDVPPIPVSTEQHQLGHQRPSPAHYRRSNRHRLAHIPVSVKAVTLVWLVFPSWTART